MHFFVMYVHVNPSADIWLEQAPSNLGYIQTIGDILLNVFGSASVPALSVLGGYLAVSAYSRRSNWWKYVRERWQTIIVPMINWNIILIVLSLIIFIAIGASTDVVRKMSPFQLLSHTTIFLVLWGVWQKLFSNEITWPYSLFFIVAPVIAVFIVYWLYKLLALMLHSAQKILAGKKTS